MTSDTRSMVLGRLTAVSFTLNAILHTLGYSSVITMAGSSAELRATLGVLWLSFTAALISLALIAFVSARTPRPSRRQVYLFAAMFPLAALTCMLIYMGYIFPVALLGVTATLSITTGLTSPDSSAITHV